MALTSTGYLKFSPPTTSTCPTPPSLPKTTQVLRTSNYERWRRRSVEGMAWVVIGLEICCRVVTAAEGYAMISVEEVISHSNLKNNVSRWSDKRVCPPWHFNSLETIVPENLPRPLAHRRWEAVGYTKNAPAVKVVATVKRTTNCFSM